MLKGIIPMIVVALIISACASDPDYYTEQEEELPSIVEEEWSPIPLPSLGNVELTRAEIQQTDEGEPERLDLYYAQEKRKELQPFFQDASNRSGFENENQVQLLYGSYSKQVDVFVSFKRIRES